MEPRKRERFAVIGLGSFGSAALHTLHQAGKEVVAIDWDQEKVDDAAAYATEAARADATDREALERLGLREVDAAIVSLGERMDVSTLTALHLKEMGVPHICVKALSEDHGKILRAIGVTEVIHPEKDAATRLAYRLARTHLVDFLPLFSGFSIVEMETPPQFVGKSLRELALRNRLGIQLIAIQRGKGDQQEMNIVPRAEDVIQPGDMLYLIGANTDLDRVREYAREHM